MTAKLSASADGTKVTIGTAAEDALQIDATAKTIAALAPYLLLAGADYIAGSGNAAIKLSDGTMICYGAHAVSATWTSGAALSYGLCSAIPAFVVPFVTAPIVLAMCSDSQVAVTAAYVASTAQSAAGITEVYIASPGAISGSSSSQTIRYIAIGRWK